MLIKNKFKKIIVTVLFILLVCENSFSQNKKFTVDGIYHITNPTTNGEMIVNGRGEILAKNSEEATNLSLLDDERTHECNYFYRMGIDKKFVDKEYNPDDGEKYTMKEGSFRSTFYDKSGNEIGLSVDKTYGASFVLNDYLAYSKFDEEKNESTLYLFNAKTKESKKLLHTILYFFSDRPVLSSSTWDDMDNNKEIIIYDDDFNEINKISGYSVINTMTPYNINLLRVGKKANTKYGTIDNFLDESFNFILEKDVEILDMDDSKGIITIKDNDVYYDYDITKKMKISEDKPYSKYDKALSYDDKYKALEATISNIKSFDANTTFVSPMIYKGKIIYEAQLENKSSEIRFPARIYNDTLDKMKEFETIDFIDEERGKIFANHGEVYDFDLNLIHNLGKDVSAEYYTCNGKTFYIDMFDSNYEKRDKFNLYDENFNVLLKDIKYADFYTFENMIQVEDMNSTKIYDTNIEIIKDFNRQIIVNNQYGVDYYSFTDENTKRMGVMDKDYNIIIDNLKFVHEFRPGYFTYQNGFKYGLMDYTGKVLLSFSIFDSMNEDSNPKDYRKGQIDGFIW